MRFLGFFFCFINSILLPLVTCSLSSSMRNRKKAADSPPVPALANKVKKPAPFQSKRELPRDAPFQTTKELPREAPFQARKELARDEPVPDKGLFTEVISVPAVKEAPPKPLPRIPDAAVPRMPTMARAGGGGGRKFRQRIFA